MTRKRAEHLTCYEIRELPREGCLVTLGAFDGPNLVARASSRVEWLALQAVVDRVYALHSFLAMKQHGGRCARCRSRRPLQIHHRRYRSHGGTHRVENLEPVCWDCHRLIHEVERSA